MTHRIVTALDSGVRAAAREVARAAREAIAPHVTQGNASYESRTKTMLARLGQILLPDTYAGLPIDNDGAALARLWNATEGKSEEQLRLHRMGLMTPEISQQWLSAAKWAASGFPLVTMGHRYCAALMATETNGEVLDAIELPFPAFVIDLPAGLISCDDQRSRPAPLDYIIVARFRSDSARSKRLDLRGKSGWVTFYFATSESTGLGLHRCDDHGEIFREPAPEVDDHSEGEKWAYATLTNRDTRCHALIRRLIAGVCLAMSDPKTIASRAATPCGTRAERRRNQRGSLYPELSIYQVGAPIQIDCRGSIREYLSGRAGSAPTIQFLVRGHWKRQHHGTNNASVKIIWVQPYWKGPVDGPIAVRPHVLPDAP